MSKKLYITCVLDIHKRVSLGRIMKKIKKLRNITSKPMLFCFGEESKLVNWSFPVISVDWGTQTSQLGV